MADFSFGRVIKKTEFKLMYNKDSLQYHGIEIIEFRNLCVENKGFTFGYPLSAYPLTAVGGGQYSCTI